MQRSQIKNYIASPLNYIGGKARILDQMLPYFPSNLDIFVDLFCGGCNVGLNVASEFTIYNDISLQLIKLLETLRELDVEFVINRINEIIDAYGFSRTRDYDFAFYGGGANLGVSVYNRDKYLKLREHFNNLKVKDADYYIILYTLILFGFNNQMRFNSKGDFNLPVGKRDFNTTIEAKLIRFMRAIKSQRCRFSNLDFRQFDFEELTGNSIVYCDPPYLITRATYNEKSGWTERDEGDLLGLLSELDRKGLKFAISNVLQHEGKENEMLNNWIVENGYHVHELFMDYHYSNYQKKSKKPESREVLITNYKI